MVMPPRPSSSGMQSIRRELQRRRPKPLAPKSSVAMKSSAPPPPPPPPPREGARYASRDPCRRPPPEEMPSSVASRSRCSAGTDAPRPRPHASSRPPVVSRSTPTPRSAVSSPRSPCRSTPRVAAAHLGPGTAVGVRTRTTTLKTGEVLVLWLRATVVSPTHGGYEVVYDGNWPPADPYGTVQVSVRDIRMIKTSPSPTTPLPSPRPSSAPSPSSSATTAAVPTVRKEMRPAPRPTRAGKSLRLIRSLLPEMERQARADLTEY